MSCLKQITLSTTTQMSRRVCQLNRSMGGEVNCNQRGDPRSKTKCQIFLEKCNLNLFWFDISLFIYTQINTKMKTKNPAQVLFLKWTVDGGNQNNLVILTFPLLLTSLLKDLIFDIKLISTILSKGTLQRYSSIII